MGKTSAIEKFCGDAMAEDAGTVVVIWPTSDIEADSVCRFLTARSEYTAECTRLILIIEDIGGGERDGDHGRAAVDSGLLNLLDGVGVTFKLPTFIVATTNHPENLLESLADRPGRFDLMLQLNPPNHQEKILLLGFISKRELTDEEKECIGMKGTEDFSIAHLEEVAVRAELHDKSYKQVVEELVNHSKRYKKNFEDRKGLGLGIN
jgi:SpoVK/Ycf46/Vps4 family AAA+-type ATPase